MQEQRSCQPLAVNSSEQRRGVVSADAAQFCARGSQGTQYFCVALMLGERCSAVCLLLAFMTSHFYLSV